MENFLLATFREEIQRCMRCGFCNALCPVGESAGWETNNPRGRMQMLRAVLDGKIDASSYLMDKIYACATCGYCLWRCPSGVKTTDVVKAARNYLARKKIFPKPVEEIRLRLEKTHSINELPAEGRMAWIEHTNSKKLVKVKEKADVVLFIGCLTSTSKELMDIARATSLILNKSGMDWTILGEEEWCCGSPLILSGMVETTRKMVQHNVEKIREKKAKTVVTPCARCYRMFAQEYPKFIGDLGFKIVHTSQLAENLIDEGKIRFTRKLNMAITYHDPCELGRHCKIYSIPRKVLNSIPSIKLLEMPRNRELTHCCGGGSVLKEINPETASKLGKKKLDEAQTLRVDAIVSSCAACKQNISGAITKNNSSIRMLDITEVIVEAMDTE